MSRKDYRQYWSENLGGVNYPPQFKPSTNESSSSRPKRRLKRNNWVLPSLHPIAHFLRNFSPDGPPCNIAEKVSQLGCAYIIGIILHVDALRLQGTNDLNFVSLATELCLVEEVRIHTFHLNHFLTSQRVHLYLQSTSWEVAQLILSYINRGPLVQMELQWERAVKVTFDDFLKPVIEAWRDNLL